MTIQEKLLKIQNEIKVPKSQWNNHSKFNYRSNEDILEAAKPLLNKYRLVIVQTDDIIDLSGNLFIKATSTLTDVETKESISNTSYAGHSLAKKGMDFSQITGSASSYARKYSLNGLFAIDDAKDADCPSNAQEIPPQQEQSQAPNQNQQAKGFINYRARLADALIEKGLNAKLYGLRYGLSKESTNEVLEKHLGIIINLTRKERDALYNELADFETKHAKAG